MNVVATLLLLPIVCLATEEHYTTVEQAKQLIQDGSTFMIAFTTKQCPHCIKLGQKIPEIEAAFKDAEIDAKFFKMDVNEEGNRVFVDQHQVDGVPTIYLYLANSDPVKYNGEREAASIVKFIKKMINLSVKSIESAESLAELTSAGVVLVSIVDADTDSSNLLKMARANLDITFATVNKQVADDIGLTGALTMIRRDGKLMLSAEELAAKNEKEISSWIKMSALPAVLSFPDSAAEVFSAGIDSIMFFVHSSLEDVAWLNEVAEAFRGQILVAFIDRNNEAASNVFSFFGIDKDSDEAAVRVYNTEKRKQFVMNEPVTAESLTSFMKAYAAGEVPVHMKSEALPEDWNANPVKVLVGSNFNEVALDTTKFVFVEFYAPWCGHCKKLAPEWDLLAEKVAELENVVIAKMDATANDLDSNHEDVQGFPTLRLYKLDNSVVEYSGERNVEKLYEWLVDQVSVEDVAASSDDTAEHEEL